MGNQVELKIKNYVHVKHITKSGDVLYDHTGENTIMTPGLNWLREIMGNSSSTPAYINRISLAAAGTIPAGDGTDLATPYTDYGLEKAIGTYATGSDAVFTISHTFTNTDTASHVVASAGLSWGLAGTLFAAYVIENATTGLPSSVTLEPGDQVAITWTVTLSAP